MTVIHRDLQGRTPAELQVIVRSECGTETTSTDPSYLRWLIRRCRQGQRRNAVIRDQRKQVRVPLYLAADDVASIDSIVAANGYSSRQHFLHAALARYLRAHAAPLANVIADRIEKHLPPIRQPDEHR